MDVEGVDDHSKTNSQELGWTNRCYQFINESAGIFVDLQQSSGVGVSKVLASTILRASRTYRSLIQVEFERFGNSENEDKRFLQVDIDSLKLVDVTWHLCEILFLESGDSNFVTSFLAHWAREYLGDIEEPGLNESDDFWAAVRASVLRGDTEAAQSWLEGLPERSGLEMAEAALADMPEIAHDMTTSEYITAFRGWQDDCRTIFTVASEIYDDPALALLFKILVGDDEALKSCCSSWVELLVARVLYQHPGVKNYDMKDEASRAIEDLGIEEGLGQFDLLLQALFSFDIYTALEHADGLLSAWGICHIADLLWHAHLFDRKEFRDRKVLAFVGDMGHQQELWEVAVRYLDTCGTLGLRTIEDYATNMEYKTDYDGFRAYSLTLDRGLSSVAESVAERIAQRHIKRGQFSSAMWWLLRSPKGAIQESKVRNILQSFLKRGHLNQVDTIIDSLQGDFVDSGSLRFFSRLRELHMHIKSGSIGAAGARSLVEIVCSPATPGRFLVPILIEAVPLLERGRHLFSRSEMLGISSALEDVCGSHRRTEFLEGVSDKDLADLRIVLSEAVAAALMKGMVDSFE